MSAQPYNARLESYGFTQEECPRCGDTTYLVGVSCALWPTSHPICLECSEREWVRKDHAYALFTVEGVSPIPPVDTWGDFLGAPIPPAAWPLTPEQYAFERDGEFERTLRFLWVAALERSQGHLGQVT